MYGDIIEILEAGIGFLETTLPRRSAGWYSLETQEFEESFADTCEIRTPLARMLQSSQVCFGGITEQC